MNNPFWAVGEITINTAARHLALTSFVVELGDGCGRQEVVGANVIEKRDSAASGFYGSL
jgi:hypothetical protein